MEYTSTKSEMDKEYLSIVKKTVLPSGTLGNVQGHFWFSQLRKGGRGCHWHLVNILYCTGKPTTKNYLVQKVKNTKAENP